MGVAESLNISKPGTPLGLFVCSFNLWDFNVFLGDCSNLTGFCVKTIGLDVSVVTSVGLLVTVITGDFVVTWLNELNVNELASFGLIVVLTVLRVELLGLLVVVEVVLVVGIVVVAVVVD